MTSIREYEERLYEIGFKKKPDINLKSSKTRSYSPSTTTAGLAPNARSHAQMVFINNLIGPDRGQNPIRLMLNTIKAFDRAS